MIINSKKDVNRDSHIIASLTENNYLADNSYYSDLEVTIYGQ